MKKKNIRFSLDKIDEAANAFLNDIGSNRLIAFYGQMGAGKTTFIKAICDKYGVQDMVNSPTFAIVNEYETAEGGKIFHFDFYRLKSAREAMDIGLDEYFDSGCLCLMEWPGIIDGLLPDDTVKVEIREVENGIRELQFLQMEE